MKNDITQEEYKILISQLEKLKERHKFFRQSHIDANNEGDQRECDAWYLTDRLSKQNVVLMKEIDTFLSTSRIVNRVKSDVISYGSNVKLEIDGKVREFVFCYPIFLNFIENSMSESSEVGKAIKGKRKGFTKEVKLEEGNVLQIKILDVS